jgi:hypothetical protein
VPVSDKRTRSALPEFMPREARKSAFFKTLDPHMVAPVAEDSTWRTTDASADFEPNAAAPIMRTQNIVHLTSIIASWFKRPPARL